MDANAVVDDRSNAHGDGLGGEDFKTNPWWRKRFEVRGITKESEHSLGKRRQPKF